MTDTDFTLREFGITDEDIEAAYPVIAELRPHLDAENFRARYRQMYDSEGYRMVGLFVGDECRAVIGYRWTLNLALGNHIYVDDLVTAERWRSHGYGAALLDHLQKKSNTVAGSHVGLDSAHFRKDAHRFYEREGFTSAALHFRREA